MLPTVIVSGIVNGVIYGVAALALTIVARSSNVINFAQGEFFTIGAMVVVTLRGDGLGIVVALVIAVAIAAGSSWCLATWAVIPARRHGASSALLLMITLAISLFGQGILFSVFGSNPVSSPPWVSGTVGILTVRISWDELLVIVTSVLVAAAITAWFGLSWRGKALTSVAENSDGSRLVGINIDRSIVVAFCLAGVVGAIAGALLGSLITFDYLTGFAIAMQGLVAAMIVGMQRPGAAFVAGVGVGLAESLVGAYVSQAFEVPIAFLAIVVILLARPGVAAEVVTR